MDRSQSNTPSNKEGSQENNNNNMPTTTAVPQEDNNDTAPASTQNNAVLQFLTEKGGLTHDAAQRFKGETGVTTVEGILAYADEGAFRLAARVSAVDTGSAEELLLAIQALAEEQDDEAEQKKALVRKLEGMKANNAPTKELDDAIKLASSLRSPTQRKKRPLSNNTQETNGRVSGARTDILEEYIEPQETNSAVALLRDGIEQLIKDEANETAPFFCLLQSMGYGKTRAMLELAKVRRVVYLPCKDLEILSNLSTKDRKFWKVPEALRSVMDPLRNQDDGNLCLRNWTKFLTAVQTCAGKYGNAKALYDAQVDGAGQLKEGLGEGNVGFYDELRTACPPSPQRSRDSPQPASSSTRDGSGSSSSPSKKRVKVEHEGESHVPSHEAGINRESLVVCLDEASALLSEKEQSPQLSFRTFRRAAKHLGIIVIFSDTSSSIAAFMPKNDPSCTTLGGKLGIFTDPIYRIPTHDVKWDCTQPADNLINLFSAGRPRWSSLLEVAKKENEDSGNVDASNVGVCIKAVETVEHLLSQDENVIETDLWEAGRDDSLNQTNHWNTTTVLPNKVAIFSCRFGLGSQSKMAPLLAKYSFATVVHVTENREHVSTTYLSEPILAEASAQYTLKDPGLTVLDHVHAAVGAGFLAPPRGDLGEMCAAAFLGLTMDKIRSRKHVLGERWLFSKDPVTLKEFLSVFGCTSKKNDDLDNALDGWEVNFTHFTRARGNLSHRDLRAMLKRRMAYYAPENTEGLDLLIAMSHINKGHGTLKVQVKNYKDKFANNERDTALDKLAPSGQFDCPPYVPNEKFSVGLLLCIGEVKECWSLVGYNDIRQRLLTNPPSHSSERLQSSEQPSELFLQVASSLKNQKRYQGLGLQGTATKLVKMCNSKQEEGEWCCERESRDKWRRRDMEQDAETSQE